MNVQFNNVPESSLCRFLEAFANKQLLLRLLLLIRIMSMKSFLLNLVWHFQPSNGSGDMVPPRVGQTQLCMKVFVQRDYSDGTMVKFQTTFPSELEGKVSSVILYC